MATLVIDKKTYDIPDNSAIRDICDAAGVAFNCRAGDCGTCQIEIVQGERNLNPLNALEEKMGMDIYNRLACQCRIKSGTVRIIY